MILCILWVLAGGIIASKLVTKNTAGCGSVGLVLHSFIVLVGLTMGGLLGVLTSNIAAGMIPPATRQYEYSKAPLAALDDLSKKQTAPVFLLLGNNSAGPYYTFCYQTDDGRKLRSTIPVHQVIIYEEARNNAYLLQTSIQDTYSEKAHLWYVLKIFAHRPQQTYVIHIPHGTLRVERQIGLKEI